MTLGVSGGVSTARQVTTHSTVNGYRRRTTSATDESTASTTSTPQSTDPTDGAGTPIQPLPPGAGTMSTRVGTAFAGASPRSTA